MAQIWNLFTNNWQYTYSNWKLCKKYVWPDSYIFNLYSIFGTIYTRHAIWLCVCWFIDELKPFVRRSYFGKHSRKHKTTLSSQSYIAFRFSLPSFYSLSLIHLFAFCMIMNSSNVYLSRKFSFLFIALIRRNDIFYVSFRIIPNTIEHALIEIITSYICNESDVWFQSNKRDKRGILHLVGFVSRCLQPFVYYTRRMLQAQHVPTLFHYIIHIKLQR